MKKMTKSDMMQTNGGSSKKLTCPICGYTRKATAFERWFGKNKNILPKMEAMHFTAKAMDKYGANNTDTRVHK
ncbi:MAG: hypothetical protein NC320_09740 [Clostridium sp.]|nr:hypothetical protein [Clostridium sp.]